MNRFLSHLVPCALTVVCAFGAGKALQEWHLSTASGCHETGSLRDFCPDFDGATFGFWLAVAVLAGFYAVRLFRAPPSSDALAVVLIAVLKRLGQLIGVLIAVGGLAFVAYEAYSYSQSPRSSRPASTARPASTERRATSIAPTARGNVPSYCFSGNDTAQRWCRDWQRRGELR